MRCARVFRLLLPMAACLLAGCDQPSAATPDSTQAAPTASTPRSGASAEPPRITRTDADQSGAADATPARKPALSLALPEEPGPKPETHDGLFESTATVEHRNRFDRPDKRRSVEWDGNLDLEQDSLLSKPRLDGVEVQMKSHF